MFIDILVAEIGSTTTLVNAFSGVKSGTPRFIGQGQAPTSVLEGDVRIGLNGAVADLQKNLGVDSIDYGEMFATSSAAGGLRMTVHGLVYDMTVKAAQAAALGAGVIIKHATAGKLGEFDIDDIKAIDPNLILLAGGTDYGERETAVFNAKQIASSGLKTPVIYAGNIQNRRIIEQIFSQADIPFYITENVYPKLDLLNIEPARRIIHSVFEEHIVIPEGFRFLPDYRGLGLRRLLVSFYGNGTSLLLGQFLIPPFLIHLLDLHVPFIEDGEQRPGEQRKDNEDQCALEVQRRQCEPLGDHKIAEGIHDGHADEHHLADGVEGLAGPEYHHQSHDAHDAGADGAEKPVVDIEGQIEQHDPDDQDQIRHCRRQRTVDHVPKEPSADKILIGFQCQNKGRESDGQPVYQRHLRRRVRIRQREGQRDQCQAERKDVLPKVQ